MKWRENNDAKVNREFLEKRKKCNTITISIIKYNREETRGRKQRATKSEGAFK